MKLYFIILIGIVSSCKAQKAITTNYQKESLKYFSDSCNLYVDYIREYLNDSVFIERHNNLADTLIIHGGSLFKLHRGSVYKIINIDEDFKNNNNYRYYYYGLSAIDTVQRTGESSLQYALRLQQRIVIYIPVKRFNSNGKEMFMYYVIGDCYPASSEKCIRSKIMNGQYGIIYFERDIGLSGFTANASQCRFILTDSSYQKLIKRKKNNN